MGRVRVPGLDITLNHLQREVVTFQTFIRDPQWMTRENYEKRRSVCDGLTFLLLNMSSDVEQKVAWALFHKVMDEYHDRCDVLHLRY
jgi:hypothetical protein